MEKKNNKSIKRKAIRMVVLIILILIGIFLGNFVYRNYTKSKFQKMLVKNDYKNYEIFQISNGEETNIYVASGKILTQKDTIITWVDSLSGDRIIMDTDRKTAIITEDDTSLKVNSLNYKYINDYFESSKQKFKYKGKDGKYYLLQFKNKALDVTTTFYLNSETKIIDKIVEDTNGILFETAFEVKVNSVSESDVAKPDIDNYHIEYSASTKSR